MITIPILNSLEPRSLLGSMDDVDVENNDNDDNENYNNDDEIITAASIIICYSFPFVFVSLVSIYLRRLFFIKKWAIVVLVIK